MNMGLLHGAVALTLLLPAATAQGIQIRGSGDQNPAAEAPAQDQHPAAKVVAEVQAVLRDAMSALPRPTRTSTKEERDAYMAAFEKARAAQEAAARKALQENAELLAQPGAAKHRAVLQTTAGEHKAAVESYKAAAKESDSPSERNEALLMAAQLCNRFGDGPAAAQKLLEQIDAEQLSARSKRTFEQVKGGLEADLKREKLKGHSAPQIEALHLLGEAKTEEGSSFALSNFTGKVVLIDFWATWCGPCRAVIPSLVEMQKQYGDEVQVLGVTRFYGYGSDFSDPKSSVPHGGKSVRDLDQQAEIEINRAFADRFDLNYPIVIANAEASGKYAVRGIPTIFVLDQQGKVVESVVGGGEANHKKLVATIDRLLGRKAKQGHAEEASEKKGTKLD